MQLIVGITGASGVIYAKILLEELLKKGSVHLIITKSGIKVLKEELNISLKDVYEKDKKIINRLFGSKVFYYDVEDITAPISSGTYKVDGMVIVPCSMAIVSAIANGSSKNLLERAADVTLKEKRKLIIVPRETPLNVIHLRNLLTLSEAGVLVVPAMPAFYFKPNSVEDLIKPFVGRILDQLGIEHNLYTPWGLNPK